MRDGWTKMKTILVIVPSLFLPALYYSAMRGEKMIEKTERKRERVVMLSASSFLTTGKWSLDDKEGEKTQMET